MMQEISFQTFPTFHNKRREIKSRSPQLLLCWSFYHCPFIVFPIPKRPTCLCCAAFSPLNCIATHFGLCTSVVRVILQRSVGLVCPTATKLCHFPRDKEIFLLFPDLTITLCLTCSLRVSVPTSRHLAKSTNPLPCHELWGSGKSKISLNRQLLRDTIYLSSSYLYRTTERVCK